MITDITDIHWSHNTIYTQGKNQTQINAPLFVKYLLQNEDHSDFVLAAQMAKLLKLISFTICKSQNTLAIPFTNTDSRNARILSIEKIISQGKFSLKNNIFSLLSSSFNHIKQEISRRNQVTHLTTRVCVILPGKGVTS